MYKEPDDLKKLTMQNLLALRDVGSDDLRRTEKHLDELKGMLSNIRKEIYSRSNIKP